MACLQTQMGPQGHSRRSVCVCVCPMCSEIVELGMRNRNWEYFIKVAVQTCDSFKVKIIKFKFLNGLSALSVLRDTRVCVFQPSRSTND